MRVAVGERQLLTCIICSAMHPDRAVCLLAYDELAISRATDDAGLKRAYDVVVAQKMLHNTNISGSYRCPFCENVVVLEADAIKYTRFKCNGCQRVSCRRCKAASHEGSCDPNRRQEEDETERFIITCYCGSKFYRGDGCNKVTCGNCRKRWCWLCKANLGANAEHHFKNEHDTDDRRCNLYGDRTSEQQIVAAPAIIPTVRRRVDIDRVEEEKTYTIEYPCREDNPPPIGEPLPVPRNRNGILRCKAKLKGNGDRPCTYKAKHNGYCGRHTDAYATVI